MANAYDYKLKYRPPAWCSLPAGWELIEKGTSGEVGVCRPDLPTGTTRFGVVRYRRPLTPEELERYDLEPA